ncbi:MAG: DUF262 domain-containing protein [Acidimicrobiia bacterium]|nr:DUF262 domain-containing protein [Acidimicrobiia bacterium]
MPEAYLDAQTQGIGEVIRSRRLFQVPDHQRDFAWTNDEVEQLFSDVVRAIQDTAPEYFLGLIVLVAPGEGDAWQILDGQQRLATTTMVYAATRTWLRERGFDTDAHDIQREYIGYRSLGEDDDLPRLTLTRAYAEHGPSSMAARKSPVAPAVQDPAWILVIPPLDSARALRGAPLRRTTRPLGEAGGSAGLGLGVCQPMME